MRSDDLTVEEKGRALDGADGVGLLKASIYRLGGGFARRRACEWFVTRWTSLGGTDCFGTELTCQTGPRMLLSSEFASAGGFPHR